MGVVGRSGELKPIRCEMPCQLITLSRSTVSTYAFWRDAVRAGHGNFFPNFCVSDWTVKITALPTSWAVVGNLRGGRCWHVRVATKYPNLTSRHYQALGVQAECVKLNGAMELAPSLGLSTRIVDLVSSGRTLKENGLIETEVISEVSARLIVNRAAYKMMSGTIPAMVERFRELTSNNATT